MTNAGATPSAGWQVEFTFADGQQIAQSWQADVTQTGTTVRASGAEWNGRLAPGGSTAFGFIATWNGSNGAACDDLYRGRSMNRFNAVLRAAPPRRAATPTIVPGSALNRDNRH